MSDGRYEQEEYLEQDEDERERRRPPQEPDRARGIWRSWWSPASILVDRLRSVSALQDCLMTRATNCAEVDPAHAREPPPGACPGCVKIG